jgi:hypothetical protein
MSTTLAPNPDLEALGVGQEVEFGLAKVGAGLLGPRVFQIAPQVDKLNSAFAHNSIGNPFLHDRGKA